MYGGSASYNKVNNKETEGLNIRTETRGLDIVVPTTGGGRQEATTMASLFALSALTRTLCLRTVLPTHGAWAAQLYVGKEVLRRLIEFAIAASTEKGNT